MINQIKLACAALLVSATTTEDHGQYHKHHPTKKSLYRKAGDKLTVHVIPHSHDDVGWLKTVDDYFNGARRDIQQANVEIELTAVINSLLDDKNRTFSEVEMKFFSMWWDKQSAEMQEKVKGLVKSGQLEMINAGWSMHDEACPTYEDMIDNMKIGHDFVLKNFGVKPRIGWQIDPFGHSNTNARIFAEMGFDAWFFARLDYQDKNKRMNDLEMEWIWMPNKDSLGSDVQIFTHAFYNHYSSPSGFNFDIDDNDPVWINNQETRDFNANQEAQSMMEGLLQRAEHYLTDDVLMLFGDDFRYINAQQNYENMDNMISYMNQYYGDQVLFKYSTPSQYVDALAAKDVKWPTKYDDMFPYSDNPDAYWTGYFTSRANDKGYTRRASHNFHASTQLYAEKMFDLNLSSADEQTILSASYQMMNELGVNQHHDAITGTARQDVANDYARRLYQSMEQNNVEYNKLVADKIAAATNLKADAPWQQCFRTNSTYLDCPVANYENDTFTMNVIVHNPSTQDLSTARVAVPPGNYSAKAFNMESQAWEDVSSNELCYTDTDAQGNEMQSCFVAVDKATAARDFQLFQVKKEGPAESGPQPLNVGNSIQVGDIKLTWAGFSTDQSMLQFNWLNTKTGQEELVRVSMQYWSSYINLDKFHQSQQASGDYIFRPEAGQYVPYVYSNYSTNATWMQGPVDSEFTFYFQTWSMGHINSYEKTIMHVAIDHDLQVMKVDVDLDSLPPIRLVGYEVIVDFQIEKFDNNQTFWTDSNGLEMQKRILNYRPTWDIQANYNDSLENVTANYYPINSAISMKDIHSDRVFTVMNDRSQAGSALAPGRIQFMQNRRIPSDDGRGMGEWVNEVDQYGNGIRVPCTYYVDIFQESSRKSAQRLVQHKQDDPAQYFFNFETLSGSGSGTPSAFSAALKQAGVVGAVTYVAQPITRGEIMVRLENLADLYDSGAETIKVDLQGVVNAMYKSANAQSAPAPNFEITEMSLTANMPLKEMKSRKIQWKTVDDDMLASAKKLDYSEDVSSVTLEPQRIRVFKVVLQAEKEVSLFLN